MTDSFNKGAGLKSCQLCSGLDPAELDTLAEIAIVRRFNRGALLFLEGDPATGFYVLLEGAVRIYKSSADGREYNIHRIRPGQMFAEVAIFKGGVFPANGAATDDSVVAFFPGDKFLGLIKESPQISLKIIGSLSGFLRDYNRQVENLSLKEVPARLASYLISEANKTGRDTVVLSISKTDLARYLGTISETLSRAFKKLKDADLIDVAAKRITIRDRVRLETAADGKKF